MSDAPERIWYNGTTLHARELRWRPPETNAHPQIEYIRADIASAIPAVQPDLTRWTYVEDGDLDHHGFQEDPQGPWVRYADIPAVQPAPARYVWIVEDDAR